MSNARKIAIAIGIACLFAVAFFQYERWRVDRTQKQQLTAHVADLSQLLRQFAVVPAILAVDPRLSAALVEENSTKKQLEVTDVNQLLRVATDRSDADVAFLMDATGNTIAASNFDKQVSFIGRNYSFRPYFTNAMAGDPASYFAVGATTGIPGYFKSEPILSQGEVVGVIAVKLEPQNLPVLWESEGTTVIVTDNLGVSILSTNEGFLYHQTKALEDASMRQIASERRYTLAQTSFEQNAQQSQWQQLDNQGSIIRTYRVGTSPVGVEPWSLTLLTPISSIYIAALRNVLILAGIALVAGLLWQFYRQQVRLAREREQLAERLEKMIEEKTQKLENAQQALIAESNYSMLGKMSAAINHEINQPLASLRLNLATLRHLVEKSGTSAAVPKRDAAERVDEDNIQSTVVDLDRTANRIKRVIDTLRALPEQNKSGFVPVDIHQLLADSVSSLKTDRKLLSKYLRSNISHLESSKYYVSGQGVLLQQALLNILYNAMDALAYVEKPEAELSAKIEAGRVVIDVRDNGPGVSKGMESSLFEPFESAPEKAGGMGLGLTLARQIVTDHGGDLSYRRTDALNDSGKALNLKQAGDSQVAHTVFSISLPLTER